MHGECELPFKNLSSKPVSFNVELIDDKVSTNDSPIFTLMNQGGTEKVTLNGKEKKIVRFEKDIDVSNMEASVERARGTGVHVKISLEGKYREL